MRFIVALAAMARELLLVMAEALTAFIVTLLLGSEVEGDQV